MACRWSAIVRAPAASGPTYVRNMYLDLIHRDDVSLTFRKHPSELFGGIANLAWAFDHEIDLEYHMRRSALPSPGRVRELLELTSRMHGTLLDRHRPLWESHLIEGLTDGRFAVYTKIHHALVDGVSAMRLMRRSLSTDPGTARCGCRGAPTKRQSSRVPGEWRRVSHFWVDSRKPQARWSSSGLRRTRWRAAGCWSSS